MDGELQFPTLPASLFLKRSTVGAPRPTRFSMSALLRPSALSCAQRVTALVFGGLRGRSAGRSAVTSLVSVAKLVTLSADRSVMPISSA
jgi:hypothetical protein